MGRSQEHSPKKERPGAKTNRYHISPSLLIIDILRANILAEDLLVGDKVSKLIADWNSEKPVAGNIAPQDALAALLSFENRFRIVEKEYDTVAKAKDALDLQQSPPNPVLPLLEELQDFKSVWTALSKIWESLHDLRDTLWSSVTPRKVRQSLDGLVAITKDMPSRMRQYSAFEYVQGVLQKLIKINPLLSELKSDSIKERHWTKIFKSCRSEERYLPSTVNLGIIWDLNLAANETALREVIVQAQGEMALEEYLRQVTICTNVCSFNRSEKRGQIISWISSIIRTNVDWSKDGMNCSLNVERILIPSRR
jgi:dynein heavy chain 1, cytosolic